MRVLLAIALVSLTGCGVRPQSQNSEGDIESIIASIFSTQAPEQGSQVKTSTQAPQEGSQVNTTSGACKTSKNEEGECVAYYLCNRDTSKIEDNGTGVIDIKVTDGPCESYLDVCCAVENRAPAPITTAAPPKEKQGCGWRNPDGVGFRITGDNNNEAKFGEFPWMSAVLELHPSIADDPKSNKLKVYLCGGSLISPRAVLTAAHCVHRRRLELLIRAGEWDTQTTKEIYPHQERDVKETIVHEQFTRASLVYDIALLILDVPMELAPNVGLACLPAAATGGLDPARAVGGVRCLAAGWGKDSIGKEGRYQVILKKVELPVIPRLQCLNQLRARSRRRYPELHASFMCAGGERGYGICKGDGGAPLVCPIEGELNRYQQYGVAAYGLGCGEAAPSVYADVGQLRAWVDYHILAQRLDPATYTY